MRPLHLEGMGVNGSLLARLLERKGIPFTWHDTEAEVNAWRACTGAIYPADSERFGPDRSCWEQWWFWWVIDPWLAEFLEPGTYVFRTKRPPHEGRYRFRETSHGLRVAEPLALHLNAQRLVPATRERYAAAERPEGPPEGARVIVTHGWSKRLSHVYWGWTRLIGLRYSAEYAPIARPAFYFREGRFVMAYAYPVPGTIWWYAGSSIIKQREARELDAARHYDRWKGQFLRLANGAVEIVEEGEYIQGWRPAANDSAWILQEGDTVYLRPLWNSGVRHFPAQWSELIPILREWTGRTDL